MHSEVRSTSLNPRVGTRLLLVNAPVMASIGLCIARHPILSLQTADLQTRIVSRLRYEFKEQKNVQAGAVLQLSLACLSFLTAFLPAGPCLRGHPCGGGGFVTSSAWGEAKVGDWASSGLAGTGRCLRLPNALLRLAISTDFLIWFLGRSQKQFSSRDPQPCCLAAFISLSSFVC